MAVFLYLRIGLQNDHVYNARLPQLSLVILSFIREVKKYTSALVAVAVLSVAVFFFILKQWQLLERNKWKSKKNSIVFNECLKEEDNI